MNFREMIEDQIRLKCFTSLPKRKWPEYQEPLSTESTIQNIYSLIETNRPFDKTLSQYED